MNKTTINTYTTSNLELINLKSKVSALEFQERIEKVSAAAACLALIVVSAIFLIL